MILIVNNTEMQAYRGIKMNGISDSLAVAYIAETFGGQIVESIPPENIDTETMDELLTVTSPEEEIIAVIEAEAAESAVFEE